jgi:uncharacterized protein YbaP (TraB family)
LTNKIKQVACNSGTNQQPASLLHKKGLFIKSSSLVLSLAVFACLSAVAQTTRFDESTGILAADCIALYENGAAVTAEGVPATYYVELQMDGDRLVLMVATPVSATADCSGKFDNSTGLYTDTGRLGDEAFDITLQLQGTGDFTLLEATSAGPANTSLWRVSKGEQESLIGGALERLASGQFPFPAVYEAADQAADVLVLEQDANAEPVDERVLEQMSLRTDGGSLVDDLSADTCQALQTFLAGHGVPVSAVAQTKPRGIANAIQSMELRRLGFVYGGVYSFYGLKAMSEEKPIIGLDTEMETLPQALDSYGLSAEQLIADSLNRRLNIFQQRTGLIQAWREGDMQYVVESNLEPVMLSEPEYYQARMVQRNQDWLADLLEMLATPELELVLVSLPHLPGEHDVLKLLQDLGYSVEYY